MNFMPESNVITLLPSPFAWCEIPGGEVKIVDSTVADYPVFRQTVNVERFAMSKYPVTNAQYAKFIAAGGYQNKIWWTADGWKVHTGGQRIIEHFIKTTPLWHEPARWQDSKWNGADYPVVGITWYEAYAFCAWLSEASGEKISLPREAQWQRAAEGDDQRIYPWGNEWDASRCNHHLEKDGEALTTPVRRYEGAGDSPFGVVDMAGNVREWCLTKSSGIRGSNTTSGKDDRITRGGGPYGAGYPNEYGETRFFRNDCQTGMTAHACDTQTGFRIALTL